MAPAQIASIKSFMLTSIILRREFILSKDKIAVPHVLFGETDLLKVALKEAKEETGVTNIVPYTSHIISVDVIQVENHIKNGLFVGDHLHLNATYLLIADEKEELVIKEDENFFTKDFDAEEFNINVINHELPGEFRSTLWRIFLGILSTPYNTKNWISITKNYRQKFEVNFQDENFMGALDHYSMRLQEKKTENKLMISICIYSMWRERSEQIFKYKSESTARAK